MTFVPPKKELDAYNNDSRFKIMKEDIKERLRDFIESEGKSCSFDPELITPLYVYRMWGGKVPLDEIERAMEEVRRLMYDG